MIKIKKNKKLLERWNNASFKVKELGKVLEKDFEADDTFLDVWTGYALTLEQEIKELNGLMFAWFIENS